MKKGDLVVVWRDNGQALITRTRSNPFENKAGLIVVQIEGISGYYSIDHVRPVSFHPSIQHIQMDIPQSDAKAMLHEMESWLDHKHIKLPHSLEYDFKRWTENLKKLIE